MIRYFALFLFLFIFSLNIQSQSSYQPANPLDSLDSPIAETPEPPVLGIEVHANFSSLMRKGDRYHTWASDFIANNLFSILNHFGSMGQHLGYGNITRGGIERYNHQTGRYGYTETGWLSGNFGQLQQDLGGFLNNFPAGSEVFSMTTHQGDEAYLNDVGENMNVDPDRYYEDLDVKNTYSLTFFAGRNTSIVNGIGYGGKSQKVMTLTTGGNKYEISAFGLTTPIILDMDGDNKLEASNGQWLPHELAKDAKLVAFDMNGDGFEELVEWVGPNDGILMVNDGGTVNGLDLFGSPGGFFNGFEKLSSLDANKDNKLTGEELKNLSVWQDKNGNAVVDKGEVASVASLGITSMNTTHEMMVSSFEQNGKTRRMWDWHPVAIMVKKTK